MQIEQGHIIGLLIIVLFLYGCIRLINQFFAFVLNATTLKKDTPLEREPSERIRNETPHYTEQKTEQYKEPAPQQLELECSIEKPSGLPNLIVTLKLGFREKNN